MLEIRHTKASEADIALLAKIAMESGRGPHREGATLEDVVENLQTLEERFPTETLVMAYEDDVLVGWLGIEKTTETMGEIGRWHPFILPEHNEEEIADAILRETLAYADSIGIERIEIIFSPVNETRIDQYKKCSAWYNSVGFSMLEENVYMIQTEPSESKVELPEGFSIEKISNSEKENLWECWFQSFSTGQDRQILDMNDEQKREHFEKAFYRDGVNDDASIVLLENNRIVGFSLVLDRTEEAHIDNFGIHPDIKRKGFGMKLMIETMNRVALQEIPMLSIGVDTSNEPAFNLYKKVGFKVHTTMYAYSYKKE